MSPPTPRPRLADPAFAPRDLVPAEALYDQWFMTTASVAPFVMRAILRSLIADGWDRQ